MHFSERIHQQVLSKKSCLVLGLDPDFHKLPEHFQHQEPIAAIEEFCLETIIATIDYICAVKIQIAWFEIYGSLGIALLERLTLRIRQLGLVVIIDAKRSDIGVSAQAYAQAYLAHNSCYHTDAITVNPWLGSESLQPFIDMAITNDRSVFILVKTSNSSADELQKHTSVTVANIVNSCNNKAIASNGFGAVSAVVGATRSVEELLFWRQQLPTSWILAPGVGAQGAEIRNLLVLQNDVKAGLLIPLSRSILYASSGVILLVKLAKLLRIIGYNNCN